MPLTFCLLNALQVWVTERREGLAEAAPRFVGGRGDPPQWPTNPETPGLQGQHLLQRSRQQRQCCSNQVCRRAHTWRQRNRMPEPASSRINRNQLFHVPLQTRAFGLRSHAFIHPESAHAGSFPSQTESTDSVSCCECCLSNTGCLLCHRVGGATIDRVRDMDSGARLLTHTRSGSLSGAPHEPGQVSNLSHPPPSGLEPCRVSPYCHAF